MEQAREPKKFKLLSRHLTLTATPMGVFRWRANPPSQVELADLLEPEFWDLVSDKFSVREPKHQGQVVEVYREDGAYYAEVLAIRLNNGSLKIRELMYVPIEDDSIRAKREDFMIEFRGKKKFTIIRVKDKHIIEEHLESKEVAESSLEKYINSL